MFWIQGQAPPSPSPHLLGTLGKTNREATATCVFLSWTGWTRGEIRVPPVPCCAHVPRWAVAACATVPRERDPAAAASHSISRSRARPRLAEEATGISCGGGGASRVASPSPDRHQPRFLFSESESAWHLASRFVPRLVPIRGGAARPGHRGVVVLPCDAGHMCGGATCPGSILRNQKAALAFSGSLWW